MATAVEPAQAPAVPAASVDATRSPVDKVIVHPLVLLSVVDHFNRMGKVGHSKRVMGLLLGSWSSKGVLDISNSFAVPFDEDEKDQGSAQQSRLSFPYGFQRYKLETYCI